MGERVGRSKALHQPRWCRAHVILLCCSVAVLTLSFSGTVFYTGSSCLLQAIPTPDAYTRCLDLTPSTIGDDATGSSKPEVPPPASSIRRHGMSIYYIDNEFGALQYAYLFYNLCYNGSHMITTSDTCVEPDEAFPNSTMAPLPCKQHATFEALRAQVPWQTEFKNFSSQTTDWITARGSRISWRNGTSATLYLGPATTNVAHFLAKVNALHVLNNATIPAFADRVDRFVILRHRMPTRLFDKRIDGIHGFHGPNGFLAVVLADILAGALGGQHPTPAELVLTTTAAGGMVELDKPFWDATDEQPLCFEKVMLFSLLKGAYWPGGAPAVDIVRNRLKERLLGVGKDQPVIGTWPSVPKQGSGDSTKLLKLLYIFRLNTRRVFSKASEAAFREFLSSLPGYQLRIIDFKPLHFKDQFAAVQEADVVICLHGANLVNPTTFGKKNLVIVEIIPYKVVHRMYESQAINSGLIYMAIRCSQGPIQEEDHKFDAFTGDDCMDNASCKLYHVHTRHVDLTELEYAQMRRVLRIANRLATTVGSQGDLPTYLESKAPALGNCKSYKEGYDSTNPRPWLSYKVGDKARTCYIHEGIKTSNSLLQNIANA